MKINKINQKGVKSFAPASVANVNCGYDILGYAIEKWGDEVAAHICEKPGVHIRSIHGDDGALPRDPEKNTASFAAARLLEHLGHNDFGVTLDIYKKMPFSSGLGSSAASAVAGVVAVNGLLGNPLTKRELLPFAIAAEQMADGGFHADNIAPCILGGFVLVQSMDPLRVQRIHVPIGLLSVVVHPEMSISTKDARRLVPDQVGIDVLIAQSANVAGLITGMFNTDFDLIKASLKDVVVEPWRKKLIPGFDEMKQAVINAGALGFGISGSGPSVFALCNNTMVAEEVEKCIQAVFKTKGLSSTASTSLINLKGAFVY